MFCDGALYFLSAAWKSSQPRAVLISRNASKVVSSSSRLVQRRESAGPCASDAEWIGSNDSSLTTGPYTDSRTSSTSLRWCLIRIVSLRTV